MKTERIVTLLFAILLLASAASARGGGGCFLAGTMIQTDSGLKQIQDIVPGDKVVSFSENGIAVSEVSGIFLTQRNYYFHIVTESREVNATAEHPFYVGNGVFKEASSLKEGENVLVLKNNALVQEKILKIEKVNTVVSVYNLQVDGENTFFANGFAVHNKGGGGGGCFLSGTKVLSSKGLKEIESIGLGEKVYSFDEKGKILQSLVVGAYSVESDSYYLINTGNNEVKVTGEHPFFTPSGFVPAKELKENDIVFVLEKGNLVPQEIVSIELVKEKVKAYNLMVDNPNTFFANGFAVHNKGGGGGSHRSSSSSSPPPNVFYYDCRQSFEENKETKQCCRETSSKHVLSGNTIATSTHPYCYCSTSASKTVMSVYDQDKNEWVTTTTSVEAEDFFYIDNNHFTTFPLSTYFSSCKCVNEKAYADGSKKLVVCPPTIWDILFGVIGVIFVGGFLFIWGFFFFGGILGAFGVGPFKAMARRKGSEWSSTVSVPKNKIDAKAKKISALVAFWAKVDTAWEEKRIKEIAKNTFLKLQECWQKRDYTEMNALMLPSLFRQHVAQLDSMKQRHEINKLEELKLLDMALVLVKKWNDKSRDEFTVWFQAQARDTIIDDRDGKKIRGDVGIGVFEEFWTFQRQGNDWKLRQIDQPEEAMNVLGEENFDENLTPSMMQRIYEKAGSAAFAKTDVASMREQEGGAIGAGIDEVKSKGGNIHRMLNFLSETDKVWDELSMKETVRECFILLNTSIEQRNVSIIRDKLTPQLFASISAMVEDLKAKKQIVQKRNLTVRNIEIALVRNFADKTKDEFSAWVSGQAQTVIVDENGKELGGDNYVADFEEFWSFKRSGNSWLLDEIGKKSEYVKQENIDEGTSKEMLKWYYKKERTI